MTDGGSLLLDAKRLTAQARVKRDTAAGVQADGQFSTALSKLTPQLSELNAHLESYYELRAVGIPVGPLPDLEKAVDRLRTHIVDVGRPTPQFLHSRSSDLAATIKAIRKLCDEGWGAWAGTQRASLTVEPSLVRGIRGQPVTDKLNDISREAGRPFSQVNVALFKLWVTQAEDLIAQLESPITPDDVIRRLVAASDSLTFSDLTQEEIDALRLSPDHARRVRLSVR